MQALLIYPWSSETGACLAQTAPPGRRGDSLTVPMGAWKLLDHAYARRSYLTGPASAVPSGNPVWGASRQSKTCVQGVGNTSYHFAGRGLLRQNLHTVCVILRNHTPHKELHICLPMIYRSSPQD
jgi:hypothetical protein